MKLKVKFDSDEIRDLYMNSETRGIEWNPSDSGIDLRSIVSATILPGETKILPSGIAVEVSDVDSDCYEIQLRPRSSLSKMGLIGPFGTIDFGYRGPMGLSVINITDKPIEIKKGERIKQLIIAPIFKPSIEFVDKLSETERSSSGFGSTGKL